MERIAKWDNVKFWMILCVVTGHVIYRFQGTSQAADSIYLFFYTFHMPVFIFIAGLFSKKIIAEQRYEKVIEYVVIYIIIKFIETLGSYIATNRFSFHFLWESGPAWFALAMAVFLFATMIVRNILPAYMFSAALFIGCLAGLDTHFGDHFASMRILVFYPVFLAGYYMDPEKLTFPSLKPSVKRLAGVGSIIFLIVIMYLCFSLDQYRSTILQMMKGKYEYALMGMGLEGVILRLLCYCFWAVIIFAIIILTGEKERVYTWVGQRSMAVFIWHILFIDIFIRALGLKNILMTNLPHYYLIAAICIGVIITVVCSYLPEFRMPKNISRQTRQTPIQNNRPDQNHR